MQIPYYFLVQQIWRSGHIPLWNPYSGCGFPLVGDIQATVFSPMRLLFATSPSMDTYNLLLVLQVLIACLSTYKLARCLALPPYASVFAAISYAFCPYILYNLELILGISYSLFPFVFWLCVRLAKSRSILDAVIAGGGCAVLIISGHPEVSFFGIIFGACLMVSLILGKAIGALFPTHSDIEAKNNETQKLYPIRLIPYTRPLSPILLLLAMSTATFCLSAPVLLPFLEYLLNSDCYKFTDTATPWVPWDTLVYSLTHPGIDKLSPYLGVVTFMMLVFAVVFRDRLINCLLANAAVAFLITSQLGPVRELFHHSILSVIMTVYALPALLLLESLLAACGFVKVIESRELTPMKRWLCIICSATAILFIPLAFKTFKLSDSTFSPRVWQWNVIIVLIFALLSWFLCSRKKPFAWFIPWAYIALSFFSIALVAKNALPVQSKFNYPQVAPISFLKSSERRILSVGDHVLRPNTNLVFGISNLRCHNPLFPQRYLRFMEAAGAKIDRFEQVFCNSLRPILNASSVEYIVTQLPIRSTNDPALKLTKMSLFGKGPIEVTPGLKLHKALWQYDKYNSQVFGKLLWGGGLSRTSNMTYSFVLMTESNDIAWYSDQHKFPDRNERTRNSFTEDDVFLPIPSIALKSKTLLIGIQVFDWTKARFVIPETSSNQVIKLECFDPRQERYAPMTRQQFKLVSETPSHIRVYKNTQAVPQCYIVHGYKHADSGDQALQFMLAPDFDPRTTVVLEGTSTRRHPFVVGSQAAPVVNVTRQMLVDRGGPSDTMIMTRPDANSVLVRASTKRAGILVLTDTYYPGWQVSVDGKKADILRANYLFRGVFIEPGWHIVEFKYRPLSFLLGVVLCGTFVLSVLFLYTFKKSTCTNGKGWF